MQIAYIFQTERNFFVVINFHVPLYHMTRAWSQIAGCLHQHFNFHIIAFKHISISICDIIIIAQHIPSGFPIQNYWIKLLEWKMFDSFAFDRYLLCFEQNLHLHSDRIPSLIEILCLPRIFHLFLFAGSRVKRSLVASRYIFNAVFCV